MKWFMSVWAGVDWKGVVKGEGETGWGIEMELQKDGERREREIEVNDE